VRASESISIYFFIMPTKKEENRGRPRRSSKDGGAEEQHGNVHGLAGHDTDGVVIVRGEMTANAIDSNSDVSLESSEMGIMVEKEEEEAPVEAAQSEHSRQRKDDDDESEEAYRLRVYGTTEKHNKDIMNQQQMQELQRQRQQQQQPLLLDKQQSSFRRLSRQFSRSLLRRQSSIVESLPETPAGWAVLVSTMASAILGYEIRLQQSLTCPPLVYGQCSGDPAGVLNEIYKHMTATPDSILRRDIQPSLFVGTRGVASSTAGYILQGPRATDQHVRFRQVLTMAQDGAEIALDWELPILKESDHGYHLTVEQRQQEIRHGPIQQPVILILHGMNNDSSFGYIRSMMRTCTDRGWVAVGMNFRGCGAHGLAMSTPRGYSGAYTGDLRFVVQHICARLLDNSSSAAASSSSSSTASTNQLFLVGNSLGANLVCKYLGEEGLSGTLPKQVAGGVALGNPMSINAAKMDPIMSFVLAIGVKRTLLENWRSIRQFFRDSYYKSQILKAMCSLSLGESDDALSRIMIRNDPVYPFGVHVGYAGGGPDYSQDASSYRCCPYIPVPTLQIIASDDFLVGHTFKGKTYFSLANPNIIVVETKCGGHLGWQESPPPPWPEPGKPGENGSSRYGLSSWSDVAAADFIQAVIETTRVNQAAAAAAAAQTSPSSSKDVHSGSRDENDTRRDQDGGQNAGSVHFSHGNAFSPHDHYVLEQPPINLRSRL
jgi:predicted alpha/beta-fold hydrolase